MAMVKCRECGNDISSLSKSCPHCGAPTHPEQENLMNMAQGMQEIGQGLSGCGCLLMIIPLFFVVLFFFFI